MTQYKLINIQDPWAQYKGDVVHGQEHHGLRRLGGHGSLSSSTPPSLTPRRATASTSHPRYRESRYQGTEQEKI